MVVSRDVRLASFLIIYEVINRKNWISVPRPDLKDIIQLRFKLT